MTTETLNALRTLATKQNETIKPQKTFSQLVKEEPPIEPVKEEPKIIDSEDRDPRWVKYCKQIDELKAHMEKDLDSILFNAIDSFHHLLLGEK